MNQAYFGNIASYDEFGLMLTDVAIEPPEPKRELQDIPGMDGTLDLSYEASDEIKFRNRDIRLSFAKADYSRRWEEIFTEIVNRLHGRHFEVSLDPDAGWYWDAFVTVKNPRTVRNKGTLQVVCDAYPYKLKRQQTIYTVQAAAQGASVACRNSRMKVLPEFETTGTCQIRLGDTIKSVPPGKYVFSDIAFTEGDNEVTVTGSGTVTIRYREGLLR